MTYTATLQTESGFSLTTESGAVLLAESAVPIVEYPPYPDPVVRPRNFPALMRGVNLSGWYTLHGQNLITADDLALIKAAGFDHVRLNIRPGYTDVLPGEGGPTDPVGFGWVPTDPIGAIPGAATVDVAIDMILTAGLECVLDLHVTNTNDDERSMDPYFHSGEDDPADYVRPAQDSFCAMWKNIAARYKTYPQNTLAFEIYNEPAFYGWELNWFEFRNRIIAAIREVDDLRYLITPTPRGGSTSYLWRDENPPDYATGLALHAYDPFDFTHRLTEWTGISSARNWVLNFKYPNQDGTTPILRAFTKDDSVSEGDFNAYLASIGYPAGGTAMIESFEAQNWNAHSYDWIADYIADHGAGRNIRMFLNEFGAYKPIRPMLAVYDPAGGHWSAPWRLEQNFVSQDPEEPSRSAYLSDARQAWERRNIAWTVFDYAGNFGVSTLSGDAYWRDNGEYCPVYEGDWSREMTLSNLVALMGELSVTAVNPPTFGAGRATTVTFTGTALDRIALVTVSGIPATILARTPTSLLVVLPILMAGNKTATLTSMAGETVSIGFTVVGAECPDAEPFVTTARTPTLSMTRPTSIALTEPGCADVGPFSNPNKTPQHE